MNCVDRGIPAIVLRILLFVAVTAVAAAAQTTINVPADVATIQAAIDAANNGDTVVVAPGTYSENLNFRGKAVTVVSAGGAANTIVDGGGIATVVTFNHGETASAMLSGFTIRNGTANIAGGGIAITNSSPTIQANVITGNHAIYGIGIDVNGGSPVIKDNVITDNHQCCGTSGFGGGGISVQGSNSTPAAPRITGNTITNNSVEHGGFGGGIDVTYISSPLIQNNYISGNMAYNYGGGINVSSYKQTLVIQNIITNNSAGGGGSGGGVSFYIGGANSLLLNNTLYGNQALDGTSEVFAYSAPAVLTNNAILATKDNALTCRYGQPTVSHNVIYSLNGLAFAGDCSAMAGTNGNVAADPLFLNAASGDFHLQARSAAIDAGDNSAASLPDTDLDAHKRIIDGNTDGNAVVDMGAYEYDPGPPAATLSTSSLWFGGQLVPTTSAPQTVTLTNTGTGTLAITSTAVSGQFAQTTTCGSTLMPGASCTFNVTFTPTARDGASGTLTIAHNAPGSPATVALSGVGLAPELLLTKTSLSFGQQLVGTTSSSQWFMVSNAGNATLSINGISVGAPFAQTNNCAASLEPGYACTVLVTFSPSARGAASGNVNVNVAAPASSQTVALSGTGIAPVVALSPTSVSFGSQPVGTTSGTQVVILSNTGNADLSISGIRASAPFGQTNNCPTSLMAGFSCFMEVAFKPNALGLQTGAVTITDDAPGGPQTVALSGHGVDFALAVSPATAARGTSVNTPYTVSPVGGPYMYPVDLSCSGLPRGTSCYFSWNPANPGANGTTGTLTISTSKNTQVGTYNVTVNGVSGSQQHTVTLTLTVTK